MAAPLPQAMNDNNPPIPSAPISSSSGPPYPSQADSGFSPLLSQAGGPGVYPPPPNYDNLMAGGMGHAYGPPPMAAGGGAYPPPPPYNSKMPGPMPDPGAWPQAGMGLPYPVPPQYPNEAPGNQPKFGMAQGAPYPAAPYYSSQVVMPVPITMEGTPHTVVVSSANVTYATSSLTRTPGTTVCPACKQLVVTRTDSVTGLLPWLICGGLIFIGLWIGCCLIPFCIEPLKDVNHFCPNCNHLIHRYKLM